MAKVLYAPTVDGIVGRSGTGVYYRGKSSIFGYLRQWVVPKYTEQNETMGKTLRVVAECYKSTTTLFRADLKEYTLKYSDLGVRKRILRARANSEFAVFYLMLWNYSKANPSMAITAMTVEDFDIVAAAIQNVKGAVEASYLPSVEGYETLTATMKILGP